MLAGLSIARCFLILGAALTVIGLLLWAFLPVHLALPPFFFTPLLALGYGFYCWRSARTARIETRE
jgi:predicted membrane metal-binding protein